MTDYKGRILRFPTFDDDDDDGVGGGTVTYATQVLSHHYHYTYFSGVDIVGVVQGYNASSTNSLAVNASIAWWPTVTRIDVVVSQGLDGPPPVGVTMVSREYGTSFTVLAPFSDGLDTTVFSG